ncbi:MAG: tetratricopeptide repeat protein [Hyphomicrobiales bacterium]|nr:tetratricopeptide repeat protein [Hyphomicrobiales bacterium]
MRRAGMTVCAGLAAALAVAWGQPASAQAQPQQRPPAQQPPQAQPSQPQTLATLYERLKATGTAQEAEVIVRQITRRWGRSGSDTSDLLMARAKDAMGSQNPPLAVELLDRLIVLQPDWAEAWHVRGIAFFLMQDDGRALVDFREALRREPGHFMALGMAAAALQRQGDERNALAAYRAVQELHPFFSGVKQAIEKLTPNVAGRDA